MSTSDARPVERVSPSRAELMEQHAAARRRRDAAVLGSDDYRAAAEEVARIEIAIAALEESPPPAQAG
ncbi:MAG: hypothetical protein M3253_06160 [Chloroflexota bacterium]|nr:hypothetical protein [Chloroflexota bacterium]